MTKSDCADDELASCDEAALPAAEFKVAADSGLLAASNSPHSRDNDRRTDTHTLDLTAGSLQLDDFTSAGNSWAEGAGLFSRQAVSPDWPR